jgi:hypothetical protein
MTSQTSQVQFELHPTFQPNIIKFIRPPYQITRTGYVHIPVFRNRYMCLYISSLFLIFLSMRTVESLTISRWCS